MLTETLKSKQINKDNNSIVIFLLNDRTSTTKLCGITMLDWVKKAISNFPTIEFDYSGEELVSFLKPRLVNSRYVIVLYSNTPLLTNASVLKIIEYVKFKEIKACKFNGGFAFDVQYLKSSNKVVFDKQTIIGALSMYIANKVGSFEPMSANMGLINYDNLRIKDKKVKNQKLADISLQKINEIKIKENL